MLNIFRMTGAAVALLCLFIATAAAQDVPPPKPDDTVARMDKAPDGGKEPGDTEKEPAKKEAVRLTLDDYVVVGTRSERKLRSLFGTVGVLSSNDIEAAHAVTVDQLLETVPGIDIQGAGLLGDKVTLNIRGLQGRYGAQRVLVLIDGRPANEEYLGDFDFRFVPLEAVERVEISKGPASALYGGLAIGGVINIVTKDPRKKKGGEVSASYGSHDSRRATAMVSTGGKSLAALFTGSHFFTDGYIDNTNGSDRDWESSRGFAKMLAQVGKDTWLTVSTGSSYGLGQEENFRLHQVNDFEYFRLESNLGGHEENRLDVRVFRSGTYQERAWFFGVDSRYHQYTAGAQVQYDHQLAEGHTLTSGAEAKTQRANVGEFAGHVEEQITETAFYLQDEIKAGRTRVTLGVRLDNNEEFGSEVSPRAGITYEVTKDTLLRAAGGKAFIPPNISDLYLPPTPFGPDVFAGNSDLDPETLWSGEIGVRHKAKIAKKEVSFDAALYRSRGVDFIDYMPVTEPFVTQRPQNFSAVTIFGGEVEIAAMLASGLRVSAGYTYTDARYSHYEKDQTIEHNHVEDIPRHTGSLSVTYRHALGHTLSAVLKIVGDRYTDPENTKTAKLHSFRTLGLTGSYKVSKCASVFARWDNVTNVKYREMSGQVAPRRTLTVGMSLEF